MKRYSYHNGTVQKLEDLVTCPSNINLAPYVSLQEDMADYAYELYGVVNHINFGSYGGHYTAHIRSDNKWYKCNDSLISELKDDKQAVPSTAYIFFFKQKRLKNATLIELLKLKNI